MKERITNSLRHTVFGAPPLSAAGLLILVLAGPKLLTSRILPYTTGVLGRAVLDLSGQPQRQASLLKIIGNTFVVQMVEALAEGHVLAEKSELGVDNVHKFVELMFPGPYAKYSERFMQGDYYDRDEVRKAASIFIFLFFIFYFLFFFGVGWGQEEKDRGVASLAFSFAFSILRD